MHTSEGVAVKSYHVEIKIVNIFAGSTSNKTRKNGTAKISATTVLENKMEVSLVERDGFD